MIDQDAIVTWLKARSSTRSPLVGAVYQGLADRIVAGQFEQPTSGPGAAETGMDSCRPSPESEDA